VSNAFKYTAINGFIQVEVYQENDELLMIISNTGKGIKAENITRISTDIVSSTILRIEKGRENSPAMVWDWPSLIVW
jgi:Histidine kinase-, DNA gyrase B-, and HSP90-like ATPase.